MGLLGSLIYNIKVNDAELQKGAKNTKKHFGSIDSAAKQAGAGIKSSFGSLASSLTPGLGVAGQLNGVFTAGISILRGATTATNGLKTALISSGIGAIVVALGLAFAGLSSWVSRTTEGTDEAQKIWAMLGATFDAVLDKVGIIGSAIGKLLKGDFKGAADEGRRFLDETSNIFEEIKSEAAEAVALQERENQLKKDKINWIVQEKRLKTEISELDLIARNTEEDSQKRQQALNRINVLQNQLKDESIKLAQTEYEIQKRRNELGDSNYEAIQKEKELEGALFDIQTQRNSEAKTYLKIQNQITNQTEKEFEAKKKSYEVKPLESLKLPQIEESPLPKSLDLIDQKVETSKQNLINWGATMTETALNQGVEAVDALGNAFGQLLTGQKGALKGFISSTLDAIRSVINALFAQAIAGQIASNSKFGIAGLALASIGIGAVSALFKAKVPEFAAGGIAPGGMALVGERGPELVNLPKGAQVFSNIESRGMNSSGGQLTAHVSGDGLLFVLNEAQRKRGNTY